MGQWIKNSTTYTESDSDSENHSTTELLSEWYNLTCTVKVSTLETGYFSEKWSVPFSPVLPVKSLLVTHYYSSNLWVPHISTQCPVSEPHARVRPMHPEFPGVNSQSVSSRLRVSILRLIDRFSRGSPTYARKIETNWLYIIAKGSE